MRGKESSDGFFLMNSGITPAYAGKSVPPDGLKINIRDHPRLCGEKEFSFAASVLSAGSPPPMRGKGVAADTMIDVTRITPAYAGKRLYKLHTIFLYRDHPRLCGEKRTAGRLENQYSGSPPPMRGKGIFFRSISAFSRITPAYAGKRSGS